MESISIAFLEALLDALPFQMAVLDDQGVIRLVNRAWREFARENGLSRDQVGVNYLEITSRAAGTDETARQVLGYLKRVFAGEDVDACMEYPCHSPTEKRYFRVHVHGFSHEGKRWALVVHENVTAEVLNRERERELSEGLQRLFRNMQEGVVFHEWIRDERGEIVDYRLVAANEAFARYTDLDVEASVGMPASRLYGMSPPPYFDVYRRVYERGMPEAFETYYPPMDRYFVISAIPWGDGFATIFFDISPMKRQQKVLEEMVERNRFLFRELQHRAKNTFSSIASLIGLMAMDSEGEVYTALSHLHGQVLAMAEVYELLYQKGESSLINLAHYLASVVDGFVKSFAQVFRGVRVEKHLEEVTLSATRANLVGLWLVEALNNTIKYAFGKGETGWLTVSLRRDEGSVEIVYHDGGRLEGEESPLSLQAKSSGFGFQVMQMVVEELDGSQEILTDKGRKIVFRFPLSAEDGEEG